MLLVLALHLYFSKYIPVLNVHLLLTVDFASATWIKSNSRVSKLDSGHDLAQLLSLGVLAVGYPALDLAADLSNKLFGSHLVVLQFLQVILDGLVLVSLFYFHGQDNLFNVCVHLMCLICPGVSLE